MHTVNEYYLLPVEVFMVPTEFGGLGHNRSRTGYFKMTGPHKIKLDKNFVVMEIRGCRDIFPNNHGVRLYTQEELNTLPFAGRVWKLKAFTHIPPRLRMVKDGFGHTRLVPTHRYSVHGYIGALIGLGIRGERVWKKEHN